MTTLLRAAINFDADTDGAKTKSKPVARPVRSLSYSRTAKRSYEKAYWNLISELATGQYVNKDNADCVTRHAAQAQLEHSQRDLEALGDHLLDYYTDLVRRKDMQGSDVLVGELPFRWQTEFPFPWMGGWLNNQDRETYERDLVVVIPGRDRSRAVIMADHYDTAYMEDTFGYAHGGHGPRLSAAGADDNHSATAALMLGAEVFLELSRAGKLGCDVWLVHLTGEEFPSDCMGARHLCQQVVQNTLEMRLARRDAARSVARTRAGRLRARHGGPQQRSRSRRVSDLPRHKPRVDVAGLSGPRAAGCLERIGAALESAAGPQRPRTRPPQHRRHACPKWPLHPQLSGEVRPPYDPRSTLYNTDGQIFSDAGVPVVLFMENYDINRKGYHDTHDTMENIDLDYGAAVSAIAIESVARAATELPPGS